MTRMPVWREADQERLGEEDRRFTDEVLARMRSRQAHRGGPDLHEVGGPYGALLAVNPEVAWHLHDLGRIWKTAASRATIPDKLREWGDVVVCVETADTAILKHHIPDFVSQGGRIAAVRALLEHDDGALTDDERASAEFVRGVLRGQTTDESYREMVAQLGERGAVEFTAFITFLLGMSRFGQAAGSAEDASWEDIFEIVRGIEDGTRDVPRSAASIY